MRNINFVKKKKIKIKALKFRYRIERAISPKDYTKRFEKPISSLEVP